MDSIVKKIPFCASGDCEIGCLMVGDEPYFDSIDLCNALGFKTKQARGQALQTHVHQDDKTNFESLVSQSQVNENIDLGCVRHGDKRNFKSLVSQSQVYENPTMRRERHGDEQCSQTMVCSSHGGKTYPWERQSVKLFF